MKWEAVEKMQLNWGRCPRDEATNWRIGYLYPVENYCLLTQEERERRARIIYGKE